MLKVWDGYDHYNDKDDWLNRSGFLQYWLPVTNASGISFVTGRNGVQKALEVSTNFTETGWIFQDRNKSAFWGGAVQLPFGTAYLIAFEDTLGSGSVPALGGGTLVTSTQCSVYFNSANYSIQIFQGPIQLDGSGVPFAGQVLATTGNNAWTPEAWNFIEVWANIDGSTGFVKVYMNSQLILQATGVNTLVTSNAWWDKLALKSNFTGFWIIDDFYYGDTVSGPGTHPATSPIGDCHVDTLFAIGNNAVQFTPLANTNWQEISEQAMDSDVSYNFDGTVGQEDTFNYGSLPAGITVIYGVQVTGAYRKDDSGPRSVKQTIISGATQQYGSIYTLAEVDYLYYTDQWILDPDTGVNWTVLGVNALKAGYNVAA